VFGEAVLVAAKYLQKFIQNKIEKWAALIKEANVTVE
jgi:hypothetical protein